MLPYPASLTVPFGRDAIAPYIRVVPVPSQVAIEPGAASWATGFVPLNMTLKTGGGVAPFGNDMNGVLNYITQNLVWLCAGGGFTFNPDVVTNSVGYPTGAVIRGASPATFWYNAVDDNPNDPDDDPAGWVKLGVLGNGGQLQTATLPAGTTSLFDVDGAGIGFVDITPNIAGSVIDGVNSGEYAQLVVFTNVGVGPLTINAHAKVRIPTDLTLLTNMSLALKYCEPLDLWCPT